MALLNLASKILNSDGTTTVFSPAGNDIEDISLNGVTVYADPAASLTPAPLPIWYAPAQTDQYFQNMLGNAGIFQTVAGGIQVFKMYLTMGSWPDATLKAFFAYLSANNIKLAVEAPALAAAPGQPGAGIEGFVQAGQMINMITRIKTLGGNLSYVAWDEPAYYGSIATGIMTIPQVAAEVALSDAAVQAIFPNVQISDTEPVDAAMINPANLQTWLSAYAAASGSQFSSFQADTNTGDLGWQANLAATLAVARANGVSTGVIVDGLDAAATDAAWSATAVANAMEILSNPATRPDFLAIQSWWPNPNEAADSNVAGSLASVAADVTAGEAAALAIPAVAQYSNEGALLSVTWTGGWEAIQNGTNLDLLTPTGAIAQQFAWATVRNFAFNPNTATVGLSFVSASGATQSCSIAAGTAGFAISASVTATTLTLAPASQTGFAGSGITDKALPTLTGTAAPNAVVALSVDGTSLGNATASTTGTWSYTFVTALTDGAHVVQAAATSYVVSVDTLIPTPPTLTLAAGSDSGYPDDDITDVAQPVFSGTADPNATIGLTIDGKTVATLQTNLTGLWSYDLNAALAAGTHTVTATAVNVAGTASPAATMQLTIDTAAQEATATSTDPLFDPAWYLRAHPGVATTAAAAYTEFLATGWTLDYDPSPFFSTSYYVKTYADVAAAKIDPLIHFELAGWQNGRNPTANIVTNSLPASVPAGTDPLIAYIQSLRYSDAIFTAAPNAALTIGLLHPTTGTAPTNDPTLAITAAPGATVTLTVGTAAVSTFTLGTTGSWSSAYAAASLADGTYTVTATQTTLAGVSTTATTSFVLDRSAPTVTKVTAAATGTTALGAGSTETIALPMSAVVQVTGSPTLALNDGGTARYVSGSNSNVLTFAYTVQNGQNTAALAVTSVGLPTGASIADSAGNAAILTGATIPLPAPVVIDTAPVTIGTGPDTLALAMSQDAWDGNAQFTVQIDGKQIGGVQTVTALHSAGQTQTFDVLGSFAAANHVVAIDFLNDAYGGSSSTDRNLYVNSGTIDGNVVSAAKITELTQGPRRFHFLAPPDTGTGAATTGVTAMLNQSATTLETGLQTISGMLSSPSQSISLDWSQSNSIDWSTAGPTTADWVPATVTTSGQFSASMNITGSGLQGTMFYRIGTATPVAAWSATPH